jgi:hypothetical protein
VWPPAGKDEVLTCRIWPGSHEGSDDAHGRLAGPYGAEPDAHCYGMTEAMWPEPSPDDRPRLANGLVGPGELKRSISGVQQV